MLQILRIVSYISGPIREFPRPQHDDKQANQTVSSNSKCIVLPLNG